MMLRFSVEMMLERRLARVRSASSLSESPMAGPEELFGLWLNNRVDSASYGVRSSLTQSSLCFIKVAFPFRGDAV